jgi:UDP-arabinose 4-epimerase
VRTIVFSSTCATYGIPQSVPIDEDHPQRPVNPYGESKLFVERLLKWFRSAHGFRYAALRYFNAAGADADGETGEDHDPETHIIPLAIQAALGRRPSVSIFGADYDTPDGTAIRDYVHVTDLSQAHVDALRRLRDGCDSIRVNLGTGRGHSVREVIRMVEAVGGRRVPAIDAARRAGDPPQLVAASGRATELLGWTPRHSDLRNIVATAWSWHARQAAPATTTAE